MSAYTTDGMYGMPVIETNCLESIECAIAFDVRDWSEDKRSAWIPNYQQLSLFEGVEL